MDGKIIVNFLTELHENNNRDWFKANDSKYRKALAEFTDLSEKIISLLSKIDESIIGLEPKNCIFRIYRDARFSKNKEPYKNHFGAYFAQGGRKSKLAGFYVHIEPGGNSFIGGGIYRPEKEELEAIRQEISYNFDDYLAIINKKEFKSIFPEIYGEKLKTAPKGYDKEDPAISYIRNKDYAVTHRVEDSFWTDPDLLQNMMKIFKTQKPFNDFLNEAVENSDL
ncbi:MAG: DUF2461 domain-containing protein [Bacteroidales bacterium]|nr:DUF2461 domain-containing protein [Bacteroidales bacterium]